MADVTLTYKGSTILSLEDSATKTIKTGGKFCEGDIGVSYVKPSGGGGEDVLDAILARTISGTYENSRVTLLGRACFENCKSLTSASFPLCEKIEAEAFLLCSNLTYINAPLCSYIGQDAFNNCSKLRTVNMPLCSVLGMSCFLYGYKLAITSFASVQMISSGAFRYCSSLNVLSFPNCSVVMSSAFGNCVKLISMYLLGSSLARLSHSNAFNSTPIGGYSASAGQFGSIFVKSSLLTSWKAATNWTYFSSRFVGK